MDLNSLFSSSPLLQSLTAADRDFFEAIARPVHLGAGQVLFEEGAGADSFFVISEGRIALEVRGAGREATVIQTLGRGELVGLSWFFTPSRWMWRARALVDSALVAFDAVSVRDRCSSEPALELHLLRILARETAARLHQTRLQLLDLYRGRDDDGRA